MTNHKVKKRKTLDKDDSTRFKIVFNLMRNARPMKLTEIAKEEGLVESGAFYHLKTLKEDNLVIELEDGFICQPLFIEENTIDDLNALMKVIVKIILKEVEMPDDATEEQIQKAVINNLEVFIRSFAIELC